MVTAGSDRGRGARGWRAGVVLRREGATAAQGWAQRHGGLAAVGSVATALQPGGDDQRVAMGAEQMGDRGEAKLRRDERE
ncbi:hypothetical protein EJB05_40595, partial [Eragrostis curvula]